MQERVMGDIKSSKEYPLGALSNFAAYDFILDGVACASMEGFLQSLKTPNIEKQKAICRLTGKAAKSYFAKKPRNFLWKLTGKLYWQGKVYRRTDDAYQRLLDRAYEALFENAAFREALAASKGMILCHTVGKSDAKKTVLTEYEFISRLMRLRTKLNEESVK